MNPEKQKTYVKLIKSLFNGMVDAEPYQITEEVVEMVDTMFDEISTCHERIRPLAIMADFIAGSVYKLLPNELTYLFGHKNFTEYLKATARDEVMSFLRQSKTNAALKVMEAFVDSWLKYTAKDRRMKICIVSGQTRWRSAITNALMGI
ncbi:hypothetical protein [Kingella bonacorsii]|uniref:Uncharacterized protein n=1 Tax=Kingella bonacorsii TaxID=2796361 RepID=A0ABS1BQM4_9NEIS|nr:hypothetical protein [Kingella bonacorsii]MBK0395544.1 hypothetical protein [Kingella bonacorsii]